METLINEWFGNDALAFKFALRRFISDDKINIYMVKVIMVKHL